MDKVTLYAQIDTFNDHFAKSKETQTNKYYYVTTEEAKERSLFINFLINQYSDVKTYFDKEVKALDLAFGSGNLTANIVLENCNNVCEIHLNDKFIDDCNIELRDSLSTLLNACQVSTSNFDFFENDKFDNSVDLLIFNPTSGGKPTEKDYNKSGNKDDLKLTIANTTTENTLIIFNGKPEEFYELFPELNNIFRYRPLSGVDFFVGFKKSDVNNSKTYYNNNSNFEEFEEDESNNLANSNLDELEGNISNEIQLLKPPRDESSIVTISESPEVTDKRVIEFLEFLKTLPKYKMDKVLETLGEENQEFFKEIIKSEVTKEDLVAVGYRKKQLEEYEKLLNDGEYFNERKITLNTTNEGVWQKFFEKNQWVFGYGLGFIFLSSLDDKKLEQVVQGYDVNSYGKRVDALMKTNGIISNLCFIEIKRNDTQLLEEAPPYRKGCWSASEELSGGVAQIQGTVASSIDSLAAKISLVDNEGNPKGEDVYNYQPKSYLVIGNLNEFTTEHGVNNDKYRSFELFRKNTSSPEIITFDELYERAKYIVNNIES